MPVKLIRTGKNLIKLFRGESKRLGSGDKKGNLTGRWFNPSKEYVKYFASGKKGERTLKTVSVSEKDYNLGRKIEKKLFPKGSCMGTDCNVILPKKNLKDVKTKKFSDGGSVNDYIKDLL